MKKIVYFFAIFIFLPSLMPAQTYNWQWAKTGGGYVGSYGSGLNFSKDEMIRDIVVDNNNNSYYLTTLYPNNPQVGGVPVTHYHDKDLLLYSLDCNGNLRWTKTIGGYQDFEQAWKISVDNNGGLYMMFYVINRVDIDAPPHFTQVHLDDNVVLPKIQLNYPYGNTPDEGFRSAFLLKYSTATGALEWKKSLQGIPTFDTKFADNQVWTMDSNNNIHAILGFQEGTHLDGLITVPPNYPNIIKYYLVRFDYQNGTMVPQQNPIALPITGYITNGVENGTVSLLYNESLNTFYIAGVRSMAINNYMVPLSYGNTDFQGDGYIIAFNGTTGQLAWSKEFKWTIPQNYVQPLFKIHGIIQEENSNNIFISGWFDRWDVSPTVFGNDLMTSNDQGQIPFVMKLNQNGDILWRKISTGIDHGFTALGLPSERSKIAQNGNEIAFAKGAFIEKWDNYSMNMPHNDKNSPLLIRLNKDNGNIVGFHKISSGYGYQDEFTAIAVDNDGNYLLGGFFQHELFTDPNDGIPTITSPIVDKTNFFVAKLAKSACSQMNTAETPVKQTDVVFYPNPVSDVLHIKTKEKLTSYEVITAEGRLMKQGTFTGNYTIDMSSVATGVYYVKVQGDGFATAGKVVKK